ncbi:phosphotransferase [Brevibacillus thermoruber]|uniref:Phosphotransferase n=1 Tax=Brevibacillus thermoruber TaxID=33942 RepID=A0A9X3Z3V6_9BACL|nr:phosphotransferase [Brevibacillus thermoruber]MDA5108980.1 phosphotransferase [Brevibacillus thermoruber]
MEKIDLSEICRRYRARVIHMTPLEDCYLLETNRGTKELRIWPRVDVMRWSFAWRERMARQGFRELERFIRTRDAKPYLVTASRGITLTDHLRHIEPVSTDHETVRQCGRIVGMMHAAQRESGLFPAVDFWRQEQLQAVAESRRARELWEAVRAKYKRAEGERRRVAELFPLVLQRLQRSADLLASTRIEPAALSVSHGELHRDNWGMINGKLYLRGFFQPTLSVQQRDVAVFLRDLYLTHEDEDQVDAFLDGYEEAKPLSYGDYTLMLAFLASPLDLWKQMEIYVGDDGQPEGASAAEIEQALVRQQAVDGLLRRVAERAEGARGESAHEPL